MEKDPKKPAAPDPETDGSKIGHTENGIPADASQEEPMGYPTSDRHHSEVAPSKK